MQSIDITTIIECAIALIFAIATYFLIPLIKSKMSTMQWETLQQWAKVLVQAYEIIINGVPGLGTEKRKQVMEKLQQLCKEHGYTFDEIQLRAALENAWADMVKNGKDLNNLKSELKTEVNTTSADTKSGDING